MPEARLEVLPEGQRYVWDLLQKQGALLRPLGFYLAGGTALALQIGHRQSADFDFFSQRPDISEAVTEWLLRGGEKIRPGIQWHDLPEGAGFLRGRGSGNARASGQHAGRFLAADPDEGRPGFCREGLTPQSIRPSFY